MFGSDFWLALIIVYLANLAGHFLPGFRKPLHDGESYVRSYIFGSGAILVGAGLWCWLSGQLAAWLGFAAFVAAAGLGCLTGYGLDLYANHQSLRAAEERDHAAH